VEVAVGLLLTVQLFFERVEVVEQNQPIELREK
jgi:hypothetical protein